MTRGSRMADQAGRAPHVSPYRSVVLVLTGMSVPLWWLALFASSAFRDRFVPTTSWPALTPFLLPDLGLAALTIMCGLHGLGGRLSPLLAGLACGAWVYATLWTIGAMFSRDIHAAGVVLMLLATVLVAFCCHGLVSTSRAGVD